METAPSPRTADDLRDLLAHVVAGVAGGGEAKWRRLVGPIERLPTWKYVRFNWQVKPRATGADREVIERAAEIIRAEHPYIH